VDFQTRLKTERSSIYTYLVKQARQPLPQLGSRLRPPAGGWPCSRLAKTMHSVIRALIFLNATHKPQYTYGYYVLPTGNIPLYRDWTIDVKRQGLYMVLNLTYPISFKGRG